MRKGGEEKEVGNNSEVDKRKNGERVTAKRHIRGVMERGRQL